MNEQLLKKLANDEFQISLEGTPSAQLSTEYKTENGEKISFNQRIEDLHITVLANILLELRNIRNILVQNAMIEI